MAPAPGVLPEVADRQADSPPASLGRGRFMRAAWPFLAILGYFGIVLIFCNPLYDTPLYDDWAYADNVRRFLDRGELRFIWTQVPFFGQLLGGALFAKLFGFSFATLHLWGLVLGVLGAFATYLLARSYGRSKGSALAVALALVSAPVYLHFCFTFMTDVPAISSFLMTLAVFALGERMVCQSRRRVALYALAGLLLAFSITVRDFTAFFVVPVLGAFVVERRQHPRLCTVAVAAVLAMVAYGIMIAFVDMPYRTAKLIASMYTVESLQVAYVITSYVGLALMPVVASALPRFFRDELGGSWRRHLAWWAALGLMLALGLHHYAWAPTVDPEGNDELMPYRPGFVSIYGLYNVAPLPGTRAVVISLPVRVALTVFGILGGALVLYAIVRLWWQLVRWGGQEPRARWLAAGCAAALLGAATILRWVASRSDPATLPGQLRVVAQAVALCAAILGVTWGLMLCLRRSRPSRDEPEGMAIVTAGAVVVAVVAFLFYIINGKFFIRYSLAVIPGALAAMLAVFRRVRFNRPIMAIGIVVWTASSVVLTRDQIAFNEARWAAGRWLLEQGVAPDQIAGGFEFECWHNEFRGPRPSPRHVCPGHVWLEPLYLLTMDTFRESTRPVRGAGRGVLHWGCEYRQVAGVGLPGFPYWSILEGKEREVEIWRRVDAPVPGRRR